MSLKNKLNLEESEGINNKRSLSKKTSLLVAGVLSLIITITPSKSFAQEENVAQETTETSESVTDYAQLQEEYLSYFGKEKLSAKFEKKLSALPTDIQFTLLQTFQIGSDEVGNILSDKDKQQFAGRIMKFYEEVHKNEGYAGKILGLLFKKIPSLEGTEFEKISTLIAQQADHYEYEMSDEDKNKLAKLQETITQAKEQREVYNELTNLGTKIKLANNN